jgi:hypothetical protein
VDAAAAGVAVAAIRASPGSTRVAPIANRPKSFQVRLWAERGAKLI